MLPAYQQRVKDLVEILDERGVDDCWMAEYEGTSVFMTYAKRKREPTTEEKFNSKVRYYFEADTVAQAVLGGYLQYLIGKLALKNTELFCLALSSLPQSTSKCLILKKWMFVEDPVVFPLFGLTCHLFFAENYFSHLGFLILP